MMPVNKLIALIGLIFIIFLMYFNKRSINPLKPISFIEVKDKYILETFISDQGWGYRIYDSDKKIIEQPHIPVIMGFVPFRSEEDAKKIGNFALEKVMNGIFPPTITLNEIDSLNIQY
jgi:hypothetical protein